MEETIIVIEAENAEARLRPCIEQGWRVKMIATEPVSIAMRSDSSYNREIVKGKIIFILQR